MWSNLGCTLCATPRVQIVKMIRWFKFLKFPIIEFEPWSDDRSSTRSVTGDWGRAAFIPYQRLRPIDGAGLINWCDFFDQVSVLKDCQECVSLMLTKAGTTICCFLLFPDHLPAANCKHHHKPSSMHEKQLLYYQ